jgi:cysteine desulfuration protein SufE
MDRYQMLIDLGSGLTPLSDQYKTEENLIDGCQSRVWVRCELMDGRMHPRQRATPSS